MTKFGMRFIAVAGLAAVALWAAAMPVEAKGDKPKLERVSGALTKNADGTIAVEGKTLTVDPNCKFMTADKKAGATLADFKDGEAVTVGYADDGGKLVAKMVREGAGHKKKTQ